jgi:hypothetical protein
VVLGVAAGDNEPSVVSFVEQTGVRFPIVWDENWLRHRLAFPPSISPFPRQVLIDADGHIAYVASEHSASDLTAAIDGTVNAP